MNQIAQLPVPERVAVALDAAERALSKLQRTAYVSRLAQPAIATARRWVAGEPIPSWQVYDQIHPIIERAGEDELAGREQAACWAVVEALYYATWHIRRAEKEAGVQSRSIGNDICEVSEQTLAECLTHAAEATSDE